MAATRHNISCSEVKIISSRVREYFLNGFQGIQRTQFCERPIFEGNNSKSVNARVRVLCLCTSSTID